MGKTKKVRNRNAGPSPIGLPSTLTTNNENQNPQLTLAELKDGHSIPITNKLDSDISDDREIACCSLANMVVEDSAVIKIIIEKAILPKVIKRICDPDHHVCIAATGCIRNISIVGGPEICKLLVDSECLMPVTNALLKEGGIPDKQKNEKYLIQLISVLWNLCENVDHATEIVTNTKVLPNLVNLLRPNIYNTELMLNTAQLINVITDANDAIKSQFTEDAVNLLKATMANGKNPNLLRVLCASILFNLSPNEHVPALLKMTLPIINLCLDFEPQTTIIQSIQPHLKGLQVQDATLERPSREVQVLIHTQKNEIDALTVSMEILTNVCTDSGDETLGEFIELDDNYDDNSMNADVNMSGNASINPEIPALIMSSGVCNRVILKAAPLSKDLERLLLSAPSLEPLLTSYLLTQSRALNCLNNIMLIFDSQVLGDMSPVWNTMGQLLAHILNMRTSLRQPAPGTNTNNNNTNLFGVPQDQQLPVVKSEEEKILERAKKLIHIEDLDDNLRDVTAIMWTVLRKNKEKPHFTPALDQVESVYNLAKMADLNEETRANAIGMLAVLGTMPQYSSIIKNLGMLFLDTLNERPLSGWIVAESLNAIFDVFADLYNDVVAELQILQRLQQFLPVLKNMIQQNKKTMDRLLLDRLDEAKVNLPRFLSYKRKQM